MQEMRSYIAVAAILLLRPAAANAQSDIFQPPIDYGSAVVDDAVTRLQHRLDSGKATLSWSAENGYLSALLHELNVCDTSQLLVFSKTSFQRDRISPKAPRAIYFSDDVYLGWCQRGEVMEVAAIDPRQGAIFYTLEQRSVDHPRLVRQNDSCLQCHASSLTENTPGLIVRSVFPDAAGLPILTTNTYRTTFRSPLAERWGGWYVTGTHGRQRHMGNMLVTNRGDPADFDRDQGANRRDLKSLVDTTPYRTGLSDIVALMVLEHQTAVQNQITLANYQTRLALRDQEILDQMDGKPAGKRSQSIQHRIDSAAEDLLKSVLFSEEASLTDPIEGTSGFAKHFASLGPRDSKGRSLRDFDLKRRMFRYPCSYLIYSEQFDALPQPCRDSVYGQLANVLAGRNSATAFAHLTDEDRRAIREILNDTKSDWKKVATRNSP